MSKEISKARFTAIILSLKYLLNDMRLNSHYDYVSMSKIQEVIDILRYYYQFSK